MAQSSGGPSLTREGDFRAWYESTLPRVYGYLLARCGDTAVAEELTQRTYIEAIASRQTFQGRSADTTWLIGIARHELLDHFRRQERDERRRIHLVRRAADTDEGEWQASDERQLLAGALRSLPVAQRMAIVLHYLDDLPVQSVADSMGRSVGAVESLLSRGRAKLRQQLGEDDDV
ncbi:MAG: RNA polymerase sigma factor [Chloroflexota bacterium]|nr:RNA polymerase sigma factor [Chloroflexota bacterium]